MLLDPHIRWNALTFHPLATYPFLTTDPAWAEVYAPNGVLLKQGDVVYRKKFADTLEMFILAVFPVFSIPLIPFFSSIASRGADAFYTGSIAQNIVSSKLLSFHLFVLYSSGGAPCLAAQARGGIITLQDLKNYTALTRMPVNITYRGNRIFSTAAPSSGAVVLSALKVFEEWPASALVGDPEYGITTHRLIQATRFGYGQRTLYGDPAYTANVTALERLSGDLTSRHQNTMLMLHQ